MTVPKDDLDRIKDYINPEDAASADSIEDQLDREGFEDGTGPLAQAIAADEDIAQDENALQQAREEAVDSLSDAGAVGGEIVRAEDGFTAIGKPANIEQEIVRTGPESGDVIAENVNTGTTGKIGEVDLVNPGRAIDG